MVNRVRKTDFVPAGNGHSVGFIVDSQNRPVLDYTGAASGRKYPRLTPADALTLITADTTLTSAHDGRTICFDSTTSRTVTLPAAADVPGMRLRFVWKQLTSASTGHAISPVAADGVGSGVHPSLTAVANKDLYSPNASDAVTDRLEIVSDGANTWEIVDYVGTFTKEA